METPDFEIPAEDHVFSKGDEIYVKDKNKHDIWEAEIIKVTADKYFCRYTSTKEHKCYPNTKRFLLRTEKNVAIFKEQENKRNENPSQNNEEEKESLTIQELIPETQKLNDENESEENSDSKIDENVNKKSSPKTPKKNQAKSNTKKVTKSKPRKTQKKKDSKYHDENSDGSENDDDNDDDDSDDDSNENEDEHNNNYGTDDDTENTSSADEKEKRKKRIKTKKPIVDNQLIVHNAWQNGIHDVDSFRNFMMENLDSAVAEFEKLYKLNNVSEFPPFKLGGELDPKEIEKFWIQSQYLWKKFFGDLESVPTKEFIKKTVSYFKLPNQLESNARGTLTFIFDPANQEETTFLQFCAFLAMFGPANTAIRKIGHWLKCPPELKDSLLYNDIPDTSYDNVEDIEMNCFSLNLEEGQTEKAVYNIPYVDTDGNYLVDQDGTFYKNWAEYFEKNNQNADVHVEIEEVNE
ncbi:hypothetical protein TRFO_28213 [Tritrichomonas foetus]|uniref:Initiator binding protein 39kDa C-terminal domain-containing protein n=1 Tax=Tritrichomonas foetus TaxID=1144522 RepID=A0A1J4K053_9EUKA|nr:hypothetical protein TRFO_28213 [Tritrichomonas foetus]|eukprot:OHT04322.1 hypothetical protein TRFO_28213 [Tritrichomonas foetus]